MKILVVEDDIIPRRILTKALEKYGHDVIIAENGFLAWEILKQEQINFVISDWIMPGITGLELCRKIRATLFPTYIFIILLTAKSREQDCIEGLQAGADDFISKPFNSGVLDARINAGIRILKLEKKLADRNNKLTRSNRKLKHANGIIKKDLQAAAKIQANLLPVQDSMLHNIRFNWMFMPSAYIAGDIFNYFKLDEHHVGFYLLDVAGHGIPAALLSVTLSNLLSMTEGNENILKKFIPKPPHYRIIKPASVMANLNNRFQSLEKTMQYFTMLYGIIDIRSSKMTISQAGHPPPIHLSHEKSAIRLGSGGFPVGMIENIDYDEKETQLKKGDRVVLYSDGITECTNQNKQFFTDTRLIDILESSRFLPVHEMINRLKTDLSNWKGSKTFEDDISLVILEVLN